MRKAMGMRTRRKGDNRRIVRGDDARRTKKGTETAKMATKTTEVMLRDCIIGPRFVDVENTRGSSPPEPAVECSCRTVRYDHHVQSASLGNPSSSFYYGRFPSWRSRCMCCRVWLISPFDPFRPSII